MRESSLTRRVVLFVLLPLAVVFAASLFWMERALRESTAAEVRADLAKRELRRQREQARQSRELLRALQVLSENAGLKAVLTLQRDLEDSGALRDRAVQAELQRTLDERIDAVRDSVDADLLAIVNSRERTVAEWQRSPGGVYLRQEIPINLERENLGRLVVGRELDLAAISGGAEAVLIKDGAVELSTLSPTRFAGVSRDWTQAGELLLGGERWLAVPMAATEIGDGRRIVMLASVDAAVAPFVRTLRLVLLPAGAISLGLVLTLVWFTSRAVTRPLQALTEACQQSIQKGILEIPATKPAGVLEIDVLSDSLHRAAVAASDARRSLEDAYLEILEALIESLEARDQYTAGHSRRVSEYSVRIGEQMGLPAAELERLRIGALLHDLGKIGVPDAVLQKDGRLTDEEFALIKKHPDIGVRILERIGAFGQYLAAVGLHHENHDGSGYPRGLRGEEIPVDARIVHVADAYDAMTSNRPYRHRMPEEKVRRIIRECSGTQFDPAAVAAFFASPIDSTAANLEKLHDAIQEHGKPVPVADAAQPLAG
jgi:HD-GYP domain-containing protein (c-di-GMP phosphodiesterase class II)